MYIRTKDGIYELKENMTIENGIYSFFGKIYTTSEKHLFRNDKDLGEFVSQSDNIAELCDRFVLKDCDIIILNKEHTQYHFEESDEWFDITDVELRKGICGAIWTSKGLIYVAKINADGKLVLI